MRTKLASSLQQAQTTHIWHKYGSLKESTRKSRFLIRDELKYSRPSARTATRSNLHLHSTKPEFIYNTNLFSFIRQASMNPSLLDLLEHLYAPILDHWYLHFGWLGR